MSKRRNKNKKAGPVKVIKPTDALAPDVLDAPEASIPQDDAPEESASGMSASAEESDAGTDDVGGRESASDAHASSAQEPQQAQSEFDDVSAALAETLLDGPVEMPLATQIESIQILDPSTMATGDGEQSGARDWDAMAVDASDSPAPDSSQSADAESAPHFESGAKGRKSDRKLKLNKLQKHSRGEPASEPEAIAPEPEPEPAPTPRPPREPRIAAFARLTEYQQLSLAHVPGLPEESDVPGHWRGVGFGLGSRRLVSAFEEVVEIMRMPQITHVPGTQPWMLGVANVRGTLLPVVDLKQFLEGERTVMHEGQRVLVVRQGGGNVAVLIDQLFGQRSFNDSQKTTVAVDNESRYGHFIKQVYRVGDNDWGVFSMSMLTRTPEFRQAAA